MAETGNIKEGNGEIAYETDKLVQNWARTFECRPERYYRPNSESEVISIVNLARQSKKTIRMVGAAHSPSDIHCTSEWMISLDNLNKVVWHDLDNQRICVQAGMRLYEYQAVLEKRGWCMPNLGSIAEQSLAGAISTCTHGSSLIYGVLSTQVEEITIVLASGEVVTCSLDKDPDLFKAALVSLGTLGVIIRLTMRASKHYNIKHTTVIISLSRFLAEYDETWKSAAYVRAWWWPYSRQVVVWRGDRTSEPPTPPGITSSTLLKPFTALSSSLQLGRRIHEGSLYALIRAPSLLPRFERILFKTQFPQKENEITQPEVAHPHTALQLDCLFSQYVDEWSVPLSSGPEAIKRLDNFITSGDLSKATGIPIPTTSSTDGQIYVHAPIEIRVSSGQGDHAFLSPAREGNPVVWIGVIMYRPYYHPTTYRKYFAAYEELMRMLGGKPHWAKQHRMNAEEEKKTWGEGMERWLSVRKRVDPDGVFVNGFVKRHLLGLLENGRDRRGVGVLDGESGRLYKRFKAVL